MKTLLALSVLTGHVVALFRSTSYSYSYGSPYYSSSNYYYSDNYYSTPYRSNSRYASEEYKSYTYMDGSSRPTVTKDQLASAARNQANSARIIQSSSSFTTGKLRYYWGSQYMPSQECNDNSGKRRKRQAVPSWTTWSPRSDMTTTAFPSKGQKEGGSGTSVPPPPPVYYDRSTTPYPPSGVKDNGRSTSYPPPPTVSYGRSDIPYYPTPGVKGSGTTTSLPVRGSGSSASPPSPVSYGRETSPFPWTSYYTGWKTGGDFAYTDGSIHKAPTGDNGNFTDFKDTLAYMNMFYVNFTDPAESLNYVETYLPDNFTTKNYDNSSTMMKDAMSSLPLNVSDRATQLAQSMMDGNVNDSASDWFNDMKDEKEYNELISSTNGSGPVQTFVGCSESNALAICTRSISDLDSSLYSYVFNSAIPNEIAWQCPDKSYYCCEWECCKEKKWSVAGIVFCVIFSILAFSCCICCCCVCLKSKEREKETMVVMYPKPQPQAYFVSVPPRVYY